MAATGTVTVEAITAALTTVIDPARGQSVVALQMVKGVTVRDGHVGFTLEVDARSAGAYEPVRKAAEAAVDKLPGVLSVTAVLTAEAAPSKAAAPHGHGQAAGGGQKVLVPGVRAIVAVASGKGGVGKSTTAINLALALKGMGLSVGLLDADIYGPSAPRMLGISGRPNSRDGKLLEPMEGWGLKAMSIGFLVPEDTPMIWRGPMVMSALEQMLRDVDWGDLDIMIVDMPPGTGDAQLTMSQRVPLAGAVIVSTPQDIALLDARKGLNMFRKVDVPVLGIIENMSWYECPKCGHRAEIFGHGGARREAARLGVDFLGEIPLDTRIRELSDDGHPIVVADPTGTHAASYRRIAEAVWTKVSAGLGGGARKMPRIVVE